MVFKSVLIGLLGKFSQFPGTIVSFGIISVFTISFFEKLAIFHYLPSKQAAVALLGAFEDSFDLPKPENMGRCVEYLFPVDPEIQAVLHDMSKIIPVDDSFEAIAKAQFFDERFIHSAELHQKYMELDNIAKKLKVYSETLIKAEMSHEFCSRAEQFITQNYDTLIGLKEQSVLNEFDNILDVLKSLRNSKITFNVDDYSLLRDSSRMVAYTKVEPLKNESERILLLEKVKSKVDVISKEFQSLKEFLFETIQEQKTEISNPESTVELFQRFSKMLVQLLKDFIQEYSSVFV